MSHERVTKLIEDAMRIEIPEGKTKGPPPVKEGGENKRYAGAHFHDVALRVHKSMHTHAIDHCRPRLKAMYAEIYKEDHIQDALHSSEETTWTEILKSISGGKDLIQSTSNRITELEVEIMNLSAVLNKVSNTKEPLKFEEKIDMAAQAKIYMEENQRLMDDEKAMKADAKEKAKEAKATIDALTSTKTQLTDELEAITIEKERIEKIQKRLRAVQDLSCGFQLRIEVVMVTGLKFPKDESNEVFCVGYVFEKSDFNGEGLKKIKGKSAEGVKAHEFLFESAAKEAEAHLEFKAGDIPDNRHGTFMLPMVTPVHKYFLGIQVFKKREGKKELLSTCLLPLAFVLRHKKETWASIDEFKIPEKGDMNPEKAFFMETAGSSEPSETSEDKWRIRFEADTSQFAEVESVEGEPESSGKVHPSEIRVSMVVERKPNYQLSADPEPVPDVAEEESEAAA
jgi:hypothetical protein